MAQEMIDARGYSCPQPVIMARQAMERVSVDELVVLVDAEAARDNVERAAASLGWRAEVEELPGGEYRLLLRR